MKLYLTLGAVFALALIAYFGFIGQAAGVGWLMALDTAVFVAIIAIVYCKQRGKPCCAAYQSPWEGLGALHAAAGVLVLSLTGIICGVALVGSPGDPMIPEMVVKFAALLTAIEAVMFSWMLVLMSRDYRQGRPLRGIIQQIND